MKAEAEFFCRDADVLVSYLSTYEWFLNVDMLHIHGDLNDKSPKNEYKPRDPRAQWKS